METVDYVVLALYIVGTLAIGLYCARRNQTANDMFAAGRRSPWWVAGLSSFMTLKSAGTFVVWGGLAYREGVVAIAITTCIGVSGLLVGWFLAGRWRQIGVNTPAEFVEFRFGKPAVQLYTWTMLLIRIVSTGVALYAVSVMLVAVIPLPDGAVLRDPLTGFFSLPAAIVILGTVILLYTIVGGLWAVLLTDVLQFVVVQIAVLFVLTLLLFTVFGSSMPRVELPHNFFAPLNDQYGLLFLMGWVAVHFFLVGAEWAFAQRYICVPTTKDARKGAYLFGTLYLISPTIWLATPILYRMVNDSVQPEQAYILASQTVLPAGMLGLMMAAMFSATASTVSAQVNVFAGVLSEQVYQRLIRPMASNRELLAAGRLFALLIGIAVILVALLVPYAGGAEAIILMVTGLLFGPMMAPTVWGLLSSRIGLKTLIATTLISFAAGLIAKVGMSWYGPLAHLDVAVWTRANPRMTDILIGVLLPNLLLTISHIRGTRMHPGWLELERRANQYVDGHTEAGEHADTLLILAVSLASAGVLMLILALFDDKGQGTLGLFSIVMLLLAAGTWRMSRRNSFEQPASSF